MKIDENTEVMCGVVRTFPKEEHMQIDEPTDVMSAMEKRVLRTIIDESGILPYPTRPLVMSVGPDALEYVIPKRDKAKVLGELYPFYPVPAITDTKYCLHEEKNFRVSSFKVIREDNRNYLVSPYYAKSGGMVIDWIEPDEKVDAGVVRPFFKGGLK